MKQVRFKSASLSTQNIFYVWVAVCKFLTLWGLVCTWQQRSRGSRWTWWTRTTWATIITDSWGSWRPWGPWTSWRPTNRFSSRALYRKKPHLVNTKKEWLTQNLWSIVSGLCCHRWSRSSRWTLCSTMMRVIVTCYWFSLLSFRTKLPFHLMLQHNILQNQVQFPCAAHIQQNITCKQETCINLESPYLKCINVKGGSETYDRQCWHSNHVHIL